MNNSQTQQNLTGLFPNFQPKNRPREGGKRKKTRRKYIKIKKKECESWRVREKERNMKIRRKERKIVKVKERMYCKKYFSVFVGICKV